jgi:hypothetical protein
MNKCDLCGGNLYISKVNNEFYECAFCKTQFRIDLKVFDSSHFDNTYLHDLDDVRNVIKLNKLHYEKLFNTFFKNNKDNYIEFKNDLFDSNINDVHCYGGGFPMLEYFLPSNNITIFDFIAKKYECNMILMEEQYDLKDKNINFIDYNLENGVIKYDKKCILTFSHILEHLTIESINKILKSIINNYIDGSYIIIYQPNPIAAKNNKWLHYTNKSKEHITLIPLNTLVKHINSFNNFKVKISMPFSDDLLIIAKIVK